MILLPLLKVGVITSMGVSIVSGILVACLVQKIPLLEVIKVCIMGIKQTERGSVRS